MALDNGVSAYEVDKVFWLISSGNYYLDLDENGQIIKGKSYREDFIKSARKCLGLKEADVPGECGGIKLPKIITKESLEKLQEESEKDTEEPEKQGNKK